MRSSIGGWVENSRPSRRPAGTGWRSSARRSGELRVVRQRQRAVPAPACAARWRAQRVAGQLCAGGVGLVLAGPAHRQLHHRRGDRPENDQQQQLEDVGAALVVVAAAEPEDRGELGEIAPR